MSDLKNFRSKVAALKRKGLLPSKTSKGNPLDARSAQPNWKLPNGRKLSTVVDHLDPVTSGKATPLQVTPERAKQFRKAGYEVVNGRVIIPHSATEKAVKEKGEIVIESASGIKRVQIPIEFHNLNQWFRDVRADAPRINRMKRNNEYFGFRYFGNNSSELFADIDDLIERLAGYEASIDANTRIKQQQVYKNIEIVKLGRRTEWETPSDRKRERSKQYNRKQAKKFRFNMSRKPMRVRRAYHAALNQRMRDYRARMKKDKKKLAAYKRAAKKRASKSRAKNTKAKKKNRRTRSRN